MPLRSVEAATREDAIAAAREQFGASARVVGVRRVRSGGVLGFFATERYVAEVDPEQSNRPPVPAPARSPGRPERGAPARNGAAAYAAEALPSNGYDDDYYDHYGHYGHDHDHDHGHGHDFRHDYGRARYEAPREPEPVRPRSKLSPAERIAAASALDAPARRPDDSERLEELAGLLGAPAARPRESVARASSASASAPRSTLAAALAAGQSAGRAAPRSDESGAAPIAFPRASLLRSGPTGPAVAHKPRDDEPAVPAAPSPFTAALARMVSGDRDVRQAVQEALDIHAAPPASRGPGSRPARPGSDTAQPAARSRAAQQEDSTVGAQDIAMASSTAPDVDAPTWTEPPAHATYDAMSGYDASREEAIAQVLRTALAQGHSDEALAGILRKVLAGAAPQTALVSPELSAAPVAAQPAVEPLPRATAPAPTFEPPVQPTLASLLHPAEQPMAPAAEPAAQAPEPALPEPVLAQPVVAEQVLTAPLLPEPLPEPVLAEPVVAEQVQAAPLPEPVAAELLPAAPLVSEPVLAAPALEPLPAPVVDAPAAIEAAPAEPEPAAAVIEPPVEQLPAEEPPVDLPVEPDPAPVEASIPEPAREPAAAEVEAPALKEATVAVEPTAPASSFETLWGAAPTTRAAEADRTPADAPIWAEIVVDAPAADVAEAVVQDVVAQPDADVDAPAVEVAETAVAEEPAAPVVDEVAEQLAPLLARTASDPAPAMSLDQTTIMPPLSLLPPLPGRPSRGRPPVPPSSRPAVPTRSAPREPELPVATGAGVEPLATVTHLPIALLDRALAEPAEIDAAEPTPVGDEVLAASPPAPPVEAPAPEVRIEAIPAPRTEAMRAVGPQPELPAVPQPSRSRVPTSAPVAPPATPAEVLERLLALGIPEALLGADFTTQVAERGAYAALTRTLATRLPAPPEFPEGAGEVLFVVGPGVETLRAARALAASLRLDPDRVQWATRGDLAGLAPRSMTTIEAAIDRRQEAATSGTVTIVAVDAPMRTDAYWMAQMLAVWTPEAVWALVEATRKPEDLEPWITGLPRVDALVVQDTDLSADPAAVLHRLDAPVALLDGVRATPHRWASLLCERLEQRQA